MIKLDELGAEQQQRSIEAVSSPHGTPATLGGRTGCHARSRHQPQELRHHSLWASHFVTATNHESLIIRKCMVCLLLFIHPHSVLLSLYMCFNHVFYLFTVWIQDTTKSTNECFGWLDGSPFNLQRPRNATSDPATLKASQGHLGGFAPWGPTPRRTGAMISMISF